MRLSKKDFIKMNEEQIEKFFELTGLNNHEFLDKKQETHVLYNSVMDKPFMSEFKDFITIYGLGRDCTGNHIYVDDTVVYVESYGKNLVFGKVMKVTPKGFTIRPKDEAADSRINRLAKQVMKIKE